MSSFYHIDIVWGATLYPAYLRKIRRTGPGNLHVMYALHGCLTFKLDADYRLVIIRSHYSCSHTAAMSV